MLNQGKKRDNMDKNEYWEIDIMNRNTIISLAMLYAFWQSRHQDLLSLIAPFVKYAVGKTTKQGARIDIGSICDFMAQEFGYKAFPPAAVRRILLRETSHRIEQKTKWVEKRQSELVLTQDLSVHVSAFDEKRTQCKERSDKVSTALQAYLNNHSVFNRCNYTQEEATQFLLSFLERSGNSVLRSVDDFQQLLYKDGKMEYSIGRFILNEYRAKSFLFDYIEELVKGYFITTAIYLQSENTDITKAAFKDVTFYLDTRVLLAFLGYKSDQENNSVQEMAKSLQKHGARLACFSYNIIEIKNILTAYKNTILYGNKNTGEYTLEYFDQHAYSATQVDLEYQTFEATLKRCGIVADTTSVIFEQYNAVDGVLNDEKIEETLLKIKPSYNTGTLSDDLTAINAVSRIRQGVKLERIELCRAVFVTTNTVLISAVRQYCLSEKIDCGFPIAINDEELCVIAWLKDFYQSNQLPRMRLMENALAAISPSKDLMDAYFSLLEQLERNGTIDDDEATLLRVDQYAREELMHETLGDRNNLSDKAIENIRYRLNERSRSEGIQAGIEKTQIAYSLLIDKQKNLVCEEAETEVKAEFAIKEKRQVLIGRIIPIVIAVLFIAATVFVFLLTKGGLWYKILLLFISAIPTIQSCFPLIKKDNYLTIFLKRRLEQKKLVEIDKRKAQKLKSIDRLELEIHETSLR